MKIAISSFSGAGTTTACKKVSEKLGLQVFNYTMRTYAAEKGLAFEDVQAASNAPGSTIDYEVDGKIIGLVSSAKDFITGSRLSAWLVPEADLYVWLEASPEERAARIVRREIGEGRYALPEGVPLRETPQYRGVLGYTRQRDDENVRRYIDRYGLDVREHSWVDLDLNVDRLDADQVAERIVQAALASGGPHRNPYSERLGGIIRGKTRKD